MVEQAKGSHKARTGKKIQEEQADGDEPQTSSDQANVNMCKADNPEESGSSQEQAEPDRGPRVLKLILTIDGTVAIVENLQPPEPEESDGDRSDMQSGYNVEIHEDDNAHGARSPDKQAPPDGTIDHIVDQAQSSN
ncbi:hypothetical protein BDR05DRAFT_950682 [Suillus weaverae]|nr:hypothetical protein BDR05DRAFT_950682 [Suillus weaverae]